MAHEDDIAHLAGRIMALEALAADLRLELDRRFANEDKLRTLAISIIEKTTQIAQQTADKAVVKAEAAAERAYTESLVDGLRRTFDAKLNALKDAILASVASTEKALVAALNSSERAIEKSEEVYNKHFDVLNGHAQQMVSQNNTFATKEELNFRILSLDKALDNDHQWQRRIELKFADYVTVSATDRRNEDTTKWREWVDRQLTAAASKSGLIYAIVAVGIAAGGLLVAVFNLFTKIPLPLH